MRLVSKITLGIAGTLSAAAGLISGAAASVNSFATVIFTPEEMAEYARNAYEKNIDAYNTFIREDYVKKGLVEWEKRAFEAHGGAGGRVLVLGSGGGREAIALAKLGYRITGIDSSKAMVEASQRFAKTAGVDAEFRRGDYMLLDTGGEKFDYCLLSCIMYSVVPSSRMRIDMLKRIYSALKPGGKAFIHFIFRRSRNSERLIGPRRLAAKIFRGNTEYSIGDTFIPPFHFTRTFHDEKEITGEAETAGFKVENLEFDTDETGYAVLLPFPTCEVGNG